MVATRTWASSLGSGTTPSRRAAPRHCMVVFARYPFAETRVQREAEALVAAGYAVDVICRRDASESPRERVGGVEVHRLPVGYSKTSLGRQLLLYLHFFALASVRLTRLHLFHRYRSVQVHNLPDFLVFCALVPKLLGAKVILDLHDLMPEFYAGRFGAGRRSVLSRMIGWQERAACAFADHVITVSDHWRRALAARGVDERKSSVVMNVADPRVFSRERTDPPRPQGTDSGFRLIYHGTVTHRYGLDLAIRAVGLVREEIPGVHLTILGAGDHMPALIALREELGLQNDVELREELLPVELLPDIIAGADLGVVPYRNDVFTDALLPTKLMEYALMGIPCVAARTSAIEAYFADTMVEFFEPGDAEDLARCLRDLWRDPERRAELARRSRNFTDRYDWNTIGAAYVGLVDRLASR